MQTLLLQRVKLREERRDVGDDAAADDARSLLVHETCKGR